MKHVSREQLLDSLRLLAIFRSRAPRQAVKHILAFLALRWRGVDTSQYTRFEERDDFAFFDEFMKVDDGDWPYFDPIAGVLRQPGHPHSNVATARKGTFFRSWHAATSDVDGDGIERWKLEDDYLAIIRKKALTKAKTTVRVPAIPLGAFLFRQSDLPDAATPATLGELIKTRFNLTTEEYGRLFEEETVPTGDFSEEVLTPEGVRQAIADSGVVARPREDRNDFQDLAIRADDPILALVRELLDDDEYGGVVFVGPPGTSKSWYAVQVALALADGDKTRIRKVQFHRSFQYEHFVEGFLPDDEGTGFELREQLMLRLMEDADTDRGATFVVLIDELSRSDPGRVFGELLTYMEPSRRDEAFLLASGREAVMPPNIVFIATMNSRDKSVLEIDDAFDRRLGKIEFPPDPAALERFLAANSVPEALARRVLAFFIWIQGKYPLGHTFFRRVKDEVGLRRLWETQLRFVLEKQFRYERATFDEIRAKFIEITGVVLG